jgi:hypothetical protein
MMKMNKIRVTGVRDSLEAAPIRPLWSPEKATYMPVGILVIGDDIDTTLRIIPYPDTTKKGY